MKSTLILLTSGLLSLRRASSLAAAGSLERSYSRPSVDIPKYVSDNLYDNAKDMVILSQYIYLHAAMVEESQQRPSDGGYWHRNKPSPEMIENRKAALESAKSIGDIIYLVNERTDLFSMYVTLPTVHVSVDRVVSPPSSTSFRHVLHAQERWRVQRSGIGRGRS
mmetsp:Transcript_26360/g.60727  ORF Transcript_26360/g.60727 Transcript_26360/m.60727 type:complete len:165 (-) Transcript_26360:1421-1915(-)